MINEDDFFVVREHWWVNVTSMSLYRTLGDLTVTKEGIFINGELVKIDRSRTHLIQKKIKYLDDTFWKILVSYPAESMSRMTIIVDAYINLKSVCKALGSGRTFVGRDIFYTNVIGRPQEVRRDQFLYHWLVTRGRTEAFLMKSYQDAFATINNSGPCSLAECKDLKTSLFEFQNRSLALMTKLEFEGTRFEEVSNEYNLAATRTHRVWVSNDDKMYNDLGKNGSPEKHLVTYRGGFLTDDMGMGKTLTLLALCVRCRIGLSKEPKSSTVLRPKSTLVLCPSHIVSHWAQEIARHTHLNCITITVKDEIKKVTVEEVMSNKFDFVIVSFNVFCNPMFRKQMDYYSCENNKKGDAFCTDFSRQSLKDRNKQNFVPHIFDWGRLIIDEFHELGNACYPGVKAYVSSIRSDRVWFVSGTPMVNKCVLEQVVPPLLWREKIGKVATNDVLLRAIKLSNVKNVQYENVEIPTLVQKVYKIELNNSERLVYDGTRNQGRDEQLRVCSYARLAKCLMNSEVEVESLDEMEDMVKNFLMKKVKEIEVEVETTSSRIEAMRSFVTDPEERSREAYILKQMMNFHKKHTETLHSTRKTLEYVEKSNQTECVICMEEMDSPCVIKSCGHKICDTCLPMAMKMNTKCPICRVEYTRSDIIRISKVGDNELLRKYGSKLYNLFNLLQETPGIKTLIFSQWDELLRDVGKCITSFNRNMNVLFCRGNILQKKSAIERFSSDEKYNLLLLSTLNAGSGCDFSVAKRVILLDTVDGSGSFISGIEQQAISRCHRIGQKSSVEVVRFIAKDTIEEEIYERVNGT